MTWDVRLIRQVLTTHTTDAVRSIQRGADALEDASSMAVRAADLPTELRRHDGAARALTGFMPVEPHLGTWLDRADLPKHVADDVDRALAHVTAARAAFGRSDYRGVADHLGDAHASAVRAQSGFEAGLDQLAEGIATAAREGTTMGLRAAG